MRQSPNETTIPIIFLPGLNGDVRAFGPQAKAFPSLTVARWEAPLDSETLAAYAERLARSLDPGRPCLVGGVSFGGIVAQEIARHVDARACLLIGSESRHRWFADGRPALASLCGNRKHCGAELGDSIRWHIRGSLRAALPPTNRATVT